MADDNWDRFDIAAKTAVSLLIAAIAGLYTYTQNRLEKQSQEKSAEVETLSKFMPHLQGDDEQAKKAALVAMGRIASKEFMTEIAALFPSGASRTVLQDVAKSSTASSPQKQMAAAALAAQGSRIDQLVQDLFDPDRRTRGAAYEELTSRWRKDPATVASLLAYALEHRNDENGIYNTVVTLKDLSRQVTQPKKDEINSFCVEAAKVGDRTRQKCEELRGWLETDR